MFGSESAAPSCTVVGPSSHQLVWQREESKECLATSLLLWVGLFIFCLISMGNVHFSCCSAHSEIVTTLERGRKGKMKHHYLLQSVAAGTGGVLDPKVVLTLHSSGHDFLRRNPLC